MTTQTRLSVAQVVDTLELGGKERVAVTLANELAARGYDSHLICTRAFGPLRSTVSHDVNLWCAERSWRGDLGGLRRLVRYLDECDVSLAHTHNEGASYLVRVRIKREGTSWYTDEYGAEVRGTFSWNEAGGARLDNLSGAIAVKEVLCLIMAKRSERLLCVAATIRTC